MLQFLKMPLHFINYYFECKKSPLRGSKIKWEHLFLFMCKIHLLTIISREKKNISLDFVGYKLFASDYTSLKYLFHEIFVYGEYHYGDKNFNPEIIYDCGANIGIASAYFKIMYPTVKIRAFEPNPIAFKLLQKNIEYNKFPNVFIHQLALSDNSEELELFFTDENLVTGSIDINRNSYNSTVKVNSVKLSDFFKQEKKIDLVKLDVEGAEYCILSELKKSGTIQMPLRYLIEFHNHTDLSAFQSFLKIFESLSYSFQIDSKINRKKNFQDILIFLK